MSLRGQIIESQKEAMKQKDETKLSVLRLLWSAVKNTEIDNGHKELSDEEVQKVAATQIKQLKDSMADFEKGGRDDLIEKAKMELVVLQEFLPRQLDENELVDLLKKIIAESGLSGVEAVGKLTGLAMKEVKGRAEGNQVRSILSKLLES